MIFVRCSSVGRLECPPAARLREEEPEASKVGTRRGETAKEITLKKVAIMPKTKKANAHVGSNFEDFLREEGRLEESTALALKRVLAWEIQQAMEKANVSQAEMARRIGSQPSRRAR